MPKNDFSPEGTTLSSQPSHTTEITNQTTRKAKNLYAIEKPTPPSNPPSPAPRQEFSHNHLSISDLETFLRERSCNEILSTYDLRILWSADRSPPITKEKLSELDMGKLYNNLYLRHDLNFDQQIHFSPRNLHDALGRQKKLEAQRFWEALEVEFALHVSHLQSLRLNTRPGSLLEERCSLPAPSTLSEVPLRLSQTIRQMCRMIATLVPLPLKSSVKARLNHRMFVQELEHGQCDIEDLFAWVGELLLESCAPSRDTKINDMVNTMGQGYRNQDPHLLRRGLQDLFSILEIMKLDATNYQFQLHRNHMLLRSIEAEQHQISLWIKNGWEVSNWLSGSDTPSSPSFTFFVTKLILLITEPTEWTIPTALALDSCRMHHLRSTFQLLCFRSACAYTLASTLHHLGNSKPLPPSSTNKITDLITAFDQGAPFISPSADPERHESLILAIAHLASSHSTPPHLPTPSTLTHTRRTFFAALTPYPHFQSPLTTAARAITDTLTAKLRTAVATELKEVDVLNLSALGLANRYTSPKPVQGPLCGTVAQKELTEELSDDVEVFEKRGLEDMARRVAHLALIHWRVWASLLYLTEMKGGENEKGE